MVAHREGVVGGTCLRRGYVGRVPDAIFADPRLAAIYDTFDNDRADLDLYTGLIDEMGARSVLEIGCGTGTLAVRLARVGIEVTAVDPAAASLEVAGGKDGAERVRWVHGDATTLPDLQVDVAVMTGNVAQVFLTDEDWTASLRGIRAALVPGGRLVFEARRPEQRAWEQWAVDTGPLVRDVPGAGEVEQRRQVTRVALPYVSFRYTYRFARDRLVATSDSTLRFRDRDEIEQSLINTGFQLREVIDAPDRPGREHVFIAGLGGVARVTDVIGTWSCLVIDCPDPRALASFYGRLVGLDRVEDSDDWVTLGDAAQPPRIALQRVAEFVAPTWLSEDAPQQMYVDVLVENLDGRGGGVQPRRDTPRRLGQAHRLPGLRGPSRSPVLPRDPGRAHVRSVISQRDAKQVGGCVLPGVPGQEAHLVRGGLAEAGARCQVDRVQRAQRRTENEVLREGDRVAVQSDDTRGSGVGGVGGVGLEQLISGRLIDHAVSACSGESARDLDVGQLTGDHRAIPVVDNAGQLRAVGLIAEVDAVEPTGVDVDDHRSSRSEETTSEA